MGFCHSPRVVNQHRADFYNIDSFLKFNKFHGKKNEDLVLAIYDYLTSKEDGSYHWWDMDEIKGCPVLKGRVITDPVKNLNVFGWMICGQMSFCLYHIYKKAGFKARQFGAPGHSISEVFYENKWHFLDVDMWTWFRAPEGHIAGAFELSQNAFELIVKNNEKSNPCNLPDRNLEGYAKMFDNLKTENGDLCTVWPDCDLQFHTMDFVLRPGESLIRSPLEESCFHLPESFLPRIKKIEKEWKGKPQERYEPFRSYGNGKWIYNPDLTSASLDFEKGYFYNEGLKPGKLGLEGDGFCLFYFYSPYMFCGIPKIDGDKVVSSEGCFLNIKGSGKVDIFIKDKEGRFVKTFVGGDEFEENIDISEILDGRHSFEIKIIQEGGATLKNLSFEGMVMNAPMALPKLKQGDNQFVLSHNDCLNKATIPYHLPIDFRNEESLKKSLISQENCKVGEERPGWLAFFKIDESLPVEVVFKMEAPNGKRFSWNHLIAVFKEMKKGETGQFASISESLDGENFRVVSERELSSSDMYWDCGLEGQSVLEKDIECVYYKIRSDTNIGQFHCFAHLHYDDIGDNLLVQHKWVENGEEKSYTVPKNSKTYQIFCKDEPIDLITVMQNSSIKI